ncbi:hypothetical protein Hanom_Chr00s000003g01603961 [Helianthus anomalus]
MCINTWRPLDGLSIFPSSLKFSFPLYLFFSLSIIHLFPYQSCKMMPTSTIPGGSKKGRKSKPKDPMGPGRTIINWKEDEFYQIFQISKFPANWGA